METNSRTSPDSPGGPGAGQLREETDAGRFCAAGARRAELFSRVAVPARVLLRAFRKPLTSPLTVQADAQSERENAFAWALHGPTLRPASCAPDISRLRGARRVVLGHVLEG